MKKEIQNWFKSLDLEGPIEQLKAAISGAPDGVAESPEYIRNRRGCWQSPGECHEIQPNHHRRHAGRCHSERRP